MFKKSNEMNKGVFIKQNMGTVHFFFFTLIFVIGRSERVCGQTEYLYRYQDIVSIAKFPIVIDIGSLILYRKKKSVHW